MVQHIQAISDTALRIEWSDDVSIQLNDMITDFCSHLKKRSIPGVVEWVPAYKTVTVYYLPHVISYQNLSNEVRAILNMGHSTKAQTKSKRVISVPVYYGEEAGPDLERVATMNDLPIEEVIARHQQPDYVVYMLGFLPGFPYLGGLDQSIATPRLETVRKETPKGSVGIAHHQTGIYSTTSPGGWNIIGKTPLSLIDVHKQNPFLFRPGDYVKFYEITKDEFTTFEQEMDGKSPYLRSS
ncbi:MAG TPA: 5-oxoprolinase subunit PxpB [Bacillota bacterium]|nr:5-oxoprolinase subunit PxpB [Bacillota bacterium]